MLTLVKKKGFGVVSTPLVGIMEYPYVCQALVSSIHLKVHKSFNGIALFTGIYIHLHFIIG